MKKFMIKYKIHALTIAVFVLSVLNLKADTLSVERVRIEYVENADGGIRLVNVWNGRKERIKLFLDKKFITINGLSSAKPDMDAKNVRFTCESANGMLWTCKTPVKKNDNIVDQENVQVQTVVNYTKHKSSTVKTHDAQKRNMVENECKAGLSYVERLKQDAYFGQDAVNQYMEKVEDLCKRLAESEDKPQFVIDNDIISFLKDSKAELESKRIDIPSIAGDIVKNSNIDYSNQEVTFALIVETMNLRLKLREEEIKKLDTLVSTVNAERSNKGNRFEEHILNYGIVSAIVLLVIILTVLTVLRKNKKKAVACTETHPQEQKPADLADNPAIVVRRRTTSILKKQCIDDVINNPEYLLVQSSEFAFDSAVRNIYIKNSCIKDIYNLYAEDLRNADNPKENGCMVLGRWVFDEKHGTYDISLEDVVYPGDDAIFKEYELNFGGIIKLRIAEKLRKLRKETNLQYDLVCWVHSHPGLGVFFSNSDDNVQMQLKHSQHPKFLIAFVIDILTANQEMGIFTFRNDSSMNSKGDLVKMYSLDEMYKWALQSDRMSFSHENYYNVLADAKIKMPVCKGVELNNNSIIDLTQILNEPDSGIVGWAVGTAVGTDESKEFVVSEIVKEAEKPAVGVIGCLINATYMSFLTIQRLLVRDAANLAFVMVYSSKQSVLTTIPIIKGELLTGGQFSGEVTIENLKIWTRRKR